MGPIFLGGRGQATDKTDLSIQGARAAGQGKDGVLRGRVGQGVHPCMNTPLW